MAWFAGLPLVLNEFDGILKICGTIAPFSADEDKAENKDDEDNRGGSNSNGYGCRPNESQ
jgi:hypothetical protein